MEFLYVLGVRLQVKLSMLFHSIIYNNSDRRNGFFKKYSLGLKVSL